MTPSPPVLASSQTHANIPLFDSAAQTASLMGEIRAAFERVVHSQRFILGEEVAAFEAEIAGYLGVQYAVGMSSCTDALLVSLLALGIGPGDEVITTPFTFFATTGAILRAGATPVFVDIDPLSFNLDPSGVERVLTPRTRAILPVHLFGQAADMAALSALARSHSLALIEDAAQALGARFCGEKVGTFGHIACFSFFPTKNLGAFGDGGLLTTNDPALAEAARCLRNHGFSPKHHSRRVGGNFRLDALQAAILRVKLPRLERWNALRRGHATYYRDALTRLIHEDRTATATAVLGLPRELPGREHVYSQFVLRSSERAALAAHLGEHGIGTEHYYPLPIHLQEACAHLSYTLGDFPHAEAAARECVAIPVFPELEPSMLHTVTRRIGEFVSAHS